MEGFPWDDLRKISHGVQGMAKVQKLPKVSTPWVGHTNVTDDREICEARSGKNCQYHRHLPRSLPTFVRFDIPLKTSQIISGMVSQPITWLVQKFWSLNQIKPQQNYGTKIYAKD